MAAVLSLEHSRRVQTEPFNPTCSNMARLNVHFAPFSRGRHVSGRVVVVINPRTHIDVACSSSRVHSTVHKLIHSTELRGACWYEVTSMPTFFGAVMVRVRIPINRRGQSPGPLQQKHWESTDYVGVMDLPECMRGVF
jgi:hypothetical protein